MRAYAKGHHCTGDNMLDTAPSGPLLERTQYLLTHAPRSISRRSIAKGSGTTEPWLSRFASSLIADPSVNKVQRVHDYLVAEIGKIEGAA